jgi:hypothetical protein
VRFIDAAVRSSGRKAAWVDLYGSPILRGWLIRDRQSSPVITGLVPVIPMA